MNSLIQIIVKFRPKKSLCMFLSSTKHSLSWSFTHISCSNTLKKMNWKFIFPWGEKNWHVLQIAKPHFTIWFWISKKSITRYTFCHRGCARIYQKSQQARHVKKNVHQNFWFFQPLKNEVLDWTYEVFVIFINNNSYILTEGRNFKTFLKINYVVALDSCYLFTKKCWAWNWTWYW